MCEAWFSVAIADNAREKEHVLTSGLFRVLLYEYVGGVYAHCVGVCLLFA